MNLKDKKGSISIFVLVMLLFMSAFLIILYANNVNKSKTIKEQFNIISQTYAYGGGDEGAYDISYTDLRKKNRQTMTASTEGLENTSSLELTKTFAENLSNYRIYGNSVQDTTNGDPSPDNPLEIQSVGNKIENLLNFKYDNGVEKLNSGITFSVNKDGSIRVKGTATSSSSSATIGISSVITGLKGTYTISGSKDGVQVIVYYKDSSGDVKYAQNNSFKLDGTEESVFAYLQIDEGKTIDTTIYPVLTEGTQKKDWELDGKYEIPVLVSSKNLLTPNNFSKGKKSWIKDDSLGDNVEISAYNNTYGTNLRFDTNIVKGETYTLSLNVKADSSMSGDMRKSALCYYIYDDENSTWSHGAGERGYIFSSSGTFSADSFTKTSVTFTAPCDSNLIALGYFYYGKALILEWGSWQLEEGNKATDVEGFKEAVTTNIYLDEPLRKVGDISDYIDFKTGQVVRNISTARILDLNPALVTEYDYKNISYLKISKPEDAIERGNLLYTYSKFSNKFQNINYDNGGFDKTKFIDRIVVSGINGYFIGFDYGTTLDQMYEAVGEDILHYVLSTSIAEPINLPELKALEDYTKIQVLTEIVPSNIEVEYQGYTLD